MLYFRPAISIVGFYFVYLDSMQGLAKQSRHIMKKQVALVAQETFQIISFLDKPNGSHVSVPDFQPHSVKRLPDGEVFTIGDRVTNGTQMVGNITGFTLLNGRVFVEHTWSGVGMNLDSLEKVEDVPAKFQVNQVVRVRFRKSDSPLTCTVRAVHFYATKTKYDLGVWLGDGSVDDPERETRIYNVDPELVTLDAA